MSFLGGLGSLVSQPGMQVIGAGLLSGVVAGGALVATGVIPTGGTRVNAATVALLACPDVGPVLADIFDGQTLLVTGRSADGAWLRVYVGGPVDAGWAPASALKLDSPADALPVADCAALTPGPLGTPVATATAVVETASPEPSGEPSVGPSPSPRVTPRVTPRPTPRVTPRPTKTPKPTPTPDTTPPSLSNMTATGFFSNGAYYITGPSSINCPPHESTITVTATDPSGVASVTLYYLPGNSGVLSTTMSPAGGNTWQGVIVAEDSWSDAQFPDDPNGLINYWVRATDTEGNLSGSFDHSNNYRLYSGVCLL